MINIIDIYNKFKFCHLVPKFDEPWPGEPHIGGCYNTLKKEQLQSMGCSDAEIRLYKRSRNRHIKPCYVILVRKAYLHIKQKEMIELFFILTQNNDYYAMTKESLCGQELFILENGELI